MARPFLASLLIGAWPIAAATPASTGARFLADFEAGDLRSYPGLDTSRAEASIVAAREGSCLRLRTIAPASSCACDLRRDTIVEKNLVLSLDHREEIEAGHEGAYLGISFYVGGEQWFWASDDFSAEWRHLELPFAKLGSSPGKKLAPGIAISRIQIYGRVKEKTPIKGETKARMTVWLDNIRLDVAEPKSRLTDKIRTSYSNPPMFQWDRARPSAKRKLQYSKDPTFPPDGTATADPTANFHTPPAPIESGTYYWRVWTSDELADGWSDVERVLVLPEAHRFVTKPVPAREFAAQQGPRLRELAKLSEPDLDERRRAELARKAEQLYRRGVPEHPGPHVEGDPRWPTWIEWYGKVAGAITGGTGRRLEELGRTAILTDDPRVIGWAKELALKACAWDPDGGSAMRHGDIGAHHLLRGLNWCYDACRDNLTTAERQTLTSIIAKRAEQFYARLNPFRHGEANNHAWLQALGMAEAGIVLCGEDAAAGDWAEYARQLYVGRFLPCLGYQGDNNEGIGYWDYGLTFVIAYGDLMRATCGIDLFEHPWLRQTARFPMYCAPPNAWAISFADTGMPNHGTLGPACTRRVRDLALRTRDPYALWYSGERDAVDGLTPLVPHDLTPSIHYRHIGVAIFNTSLVDGREGVTVAMHSGPYQAGHQHPDQNSFVIHAYGEKLAIDGGYYDWYGSPHFKAYSMNTISHNTVLVNGEGQAACTEGADGRITSWFDSPGYGYVAGDASDPEVYRGALSQFDRGILFIKPGLVAIRDHLKAPAATAAYDWLLHALSPIETDESGFFSIDRPRAALRGRFLHPEDVRLKVTTGFPVEPVNRYSRDPVPKDKYFPEWTLHAHPATARPDQDFFAIMQIQRKTDAPEPPARIEPLAIAGATAARISVDGKTHLVVWPNDNGRGPNSFGLVETDAACATIELSANGAPVAGLIVNGTVLRYGQRQLIILKQRGCASFP